MEEVGLIEVRAFVIVLIYCLCPLSSHSNISIALMCIFFTVTARRKDPNASEIEVEGGREEEQPEEVGAEEVGLIKVRAFIILIYCLCPLSSHSNISIALMCILFTLTARRKDPNASEIEVEREREGEGGRAT